MDTDGIGYDELQYSIDGFEDAIRALNGQLPNIGGNETAVCVNCDEEKETHSLCSDCLVKIINENKHDNC